MSEQTVDSILQSWLKANGYDGLFSAWAECACTNDDLAPCGSIRMDCQAGYRVNGCDCGEGHEWHISSIKPNALKEAGR
jgi:hypothetical protein